MIGTAVTLLMAWAIRSFGQRSIARRIEDPHERYSRRKLLSTSVTGATVAVLVVLWSSRLPNAGTFLGLLGAGVAVFRPANQQNESPSRAVSHHG